MRNYIRRQLALGLAADIAQGVAWLAALVLVLALLSILCPSARAEEPAYWPPCDAPDADPRCPKPTPHVPMRVPPEVQCSP